MDILSKLQNIFHFDFSGLKKFQNKITLNFQVNSNNQKVTINGSVILIDPNVLNKGEIHKVQNLIKGTLEKERIPILQDNTQKLIEDFKKIDAETENQVIISFFRGKIPAIDIEILRQSIYLKIVHDRGDDIRKLKLDIVNRYGNRGRNICNLYSAGYFISQIKPLYEEMISQPNFSPKDFEDVYERIAIESPYAVFISAVMSSQEAEVEVNQKQDFRFN